MMHEHFRECLENLDGVLAVKIWKHVFPNLPCPKTDKETLIVMHHARTQANSISSDKRYYSHRWLLDRGYPSGLPDFMRPSAERAYPRVVKAVGLAFGANDHSQRAAMKEVEREVAKIVEDIFADDPDTDSSIVKKHILEGKSIASQKLLGRR